MSSLQSNIVTSESQNTVTKDFNFFRLSKDLMIFVQATKPQVGKSGKKICCSCPETRKPRDECVVNHGEENCQKYIEAHKACLREEGFKV